MNLHNLFNQFTGTANIESTAGSNPEGAGDTLSKLTSHIPGGLAGGAAAGGAVSRRGGEQNPANAAAARPGRLCPRPARSPDSRSDSAVARAL